MPKPKYPPAIRDLQDRYERVQLLFKDAKKLLDQLESQMDELDLRMTAIIEGKDGNG